MPAYQVVFIGGFADAWAGCLSRMERDFSGFLTDAPFAGAYYHWDGGGCGVFRDRCDRIAADVDAARRAHPDLPFVLVGHSYGGSCALEVARRQTAHAMPLCVVTIDPVARRQKPARPACVDWWGNSYLVKAWGIKDVLPAIGGRWNYCAGADVNLEFSGRNKDIYGRKFCHDRPNAMFTEAPEAGVKSLFDCVAEWLSIRIK